jgi:hypothetical protein
VCASFAWNTSDDSAAFEVNAVITGTNCSSSASQCGLAVDCVGVWGLDSYRGVWGSEMLRVATRVGQVILR